MRGYPGSPIEWTPRLAERKGLYVGLLPMWGKDCPADTGNCERYGRFIGEQFKDHANLIWILGGDKPAPTKPEQEAWRAMAKGIATGVSGREDYHRVLMTYHTFWPDASSKYFREDSWLDFNGIQSSHGNATLNWKMIERDYQRQPTKPVIDLETSYPGIGLNKMAPGIMVPVAPVAKREGNRLTIEAFDLKPCIDLCVSKGFLGPVDYLLTIQVGWESRVLHGVLRSDDLKLTVAQRGAEPVRLPLEMSNVPSK